MDLIPLTLDDFDLIMGMDWLSRQRTSRLFHKDCKPLRCEWKKGSIKGREEGDSKLHNLGHDGRETN